MDKDFYSLSEENFETLLAYYTITKKKAEKYHNYIKEYKKYTYDYLINIRELFKADENISDVNNILNEYEKIEIDYKINCNNNKLNSSKNLTNNSNNNILKIEKNLKITPLQRPIDKINKFFNYQIESLQLFVDTLQNPLDQLYQSIEQSQNAINNIINDYNAEKQNYLKKYGDYDTLNKEFKLDYMKVERKLVDHIVNKKLFRINILEDQSLENEINMIIFDKMNHEKEIIEQFKAFKDIGKKFSESSSQKINEIKLKSSGLFKNFEMCLNNLLTFYKKSFLLPINQIINQEKENNHANEFDSLLSNNIKVIDGNNNKIEPDKYQLNIIKINGISNEEKQKQKVNNDISFELTNDEKDLFDEEDIYYIVKKMYNLKLVNEDKYEINIEKEKLKLKEKIEKLTNYANHRKKTIDISDKNMPLTNIKKGINKLNNTVENKENNMDQEFKIENYNLNKKENNDQNNGINIINDYIGNISEDNLIYEEEPLTKEDINYIFKDMKKQEYRLYFLTKINNFRALGAFKMPLKAFNNLVQIFKEISKYLFTYKEIQKEGKKKTEIKIDIELSKLVIILSQTFYCMKDGKKVYIQNEINTEKVFHYIEFWYNIIKINIEKEIESCLKNDKKIGKEDDEISIIQRRDSIGFAQIIPQLSGMHGFGLKIEEIKKIVLPLIEEYNLSKENKETIMKIVENPNLL